MNARGAILVITMWILAILAAVTISVGARTALDLRLARYHVEALKARDVAISGVRRALEQLRLETNEFDGLSEPWATGIDPQTGQAIYRSAFGDGRYEVAVEDELAKISLNQAPLEVLRRLPGVSDELAASILDWRDPDSLSTAPGGAEDPEYRSLDGGYPCKNGPFESVPELLLVRGATPAVFKRLMPLVTAHGAPESQLMELNLNTAPPDVLEKVGLSDVLIGLIQQYRVGPDGLPLTGDDQVFRDPSPVSIVNALAAVLPLSGEDQAQFEGELIQLQSWLKPVVASNRFLIRSIGRVGGVTVTMTAVVARQGVQNATTFLYWNET